MAQPFCVSGRIGVLGHSQSKSISVPVCAEGEAAESVSQLCSDRPAPIAPIVFYSGYGVCTFMLFCDSPVYNMLFGDVRFGKNVHKAFAVFTADPVHPFSFKLSPYFGFVRGTFPSQPPHNKTMTNTGKIIQMILFMANINLSVRNFSIFSYYTAEKSICQ